MEQSAELNKLSIKELIANGEDLFVEFKERDSGITPDDFVAFANAAGGIILIGINDEGGIVGHDISDETKKKLQTKADSCLPRITLKIESIKVDGKEILKVIIPNGTTKPYCTSGGNYKIRTNTGNVGVDPVMLERIIFEREYESFAKRLREATREIDLEINDIQEKVNGINRMVDGKLQQVIASLDSILHKVAAGEALTVQLTDFSRRDSELLRILQEIERLIKERNS